MQLTVKQARERRGWTLADVQARTGLQKSTVSRIERGVVRPTYDTAEKLRLAFGLKPGALVFPEAA